MIIVWSDEANEGLDEIIEYLENNWTDREIKNFFIRLEACLDKIAEAPHRQKILCENRELKNINILLKPLSSILMITIMLTFYVCG